MASELRRDLGQRVAMLVVRDDDELVPGDVLLREFAQRACAST
jgi:hypothetical protein